MQDELGGKKALASLGDDACQLLIVRHGETEWNKERRLQGQMHPGPSLNQQGRRQSAALATGLATSKPIHHIYTSDLLRALETAEILGEELAKLYQVPPITRLPLLRERALGVLQGLTYSDAAEQEPEAFLALRSRDSASAIPGGGESWNELCDRAAAALSSIAGAHPGQRVVVVTHGGFINAAHHQATGHGPTGRVANCSINVLRIGSTSLGGSMAWAVELWGDVAHLEDGVGWSHAAFGGSDSG